MQNNNTLTEILTALFFVAEKNGAELCYNSDDGKIYAVKERDGNAASLLPLNGDNAPVVCFNPEKLIFLYDLKTRSEINGVLTGFNGIETGLKRDNNGIITGKNADGERLIAGPGTETARVLNGVNTIEERAVIGKGKVNLPRFSDLYAGDVAAVAVQVEALIDKIIFATNKPETIKKIIAQYENAKKAAQKGNLFALKQIEKSLCGIAEKQKAIAKGVEKMQHKAQVKKRLIKCLTIAALLSGIFFYFSHFYRSTPTPQKDYTVVAVNSIFDDAVAEFERETGKKIYPKGRECLSRACRKCKTKKECLTIIKNNVK